MYLVLDSVTEEANEIELLCDSIVGFLILFVKVTTTLLPAAASELNVIVPVLAVSLTAHVWLVLDIAALHDPFESTVISDGKVIKSSPPLEGIEFVKTIVNW